ncbi:MAG: radical SAM protein [Bacillota bacterium]|nr:radical SAM protein [Bacillota bacterium]
MADPALLYADPAGRTLDEPQLVATGRSWDTTYALTPEDLIPLPEGATLVSLPGRPPVGQDPATGEFLEVAVEDADHPLSAVAALLPQGYTRLHLPGYGLPEEGTEPPPLPLFGYTAAAWHRGGFAVAAVRTDPPEAADKWNPVHYNRPSLAEKISALAQEFPANRLVDHLARCATEYRCFTAQNLFYRRWEAGIPVSPACNAACAGCLSREPLGGAPSPQERLDFVPTPEEIAELAVAHLVKAPEAIVSFGQGCEGEPSLQAGVLAEAIRLIRQKTGRGTINLNTNAGNPEAIGLLVEAGLDSLRVTLISARPAIYQAYHRPAGFGLKEVEASLRLARRQGVYVSLNLLVFPGLSDRPEELGALSDFIQANRISLVQLRNLNLDPDVLVRLLPPPQEEPRGMRRLVEELRSLPGVEVGNSSRPVGRRTGRAGSGGEDSPTKAKEGTR